MYYSINMKFHYALFVVATIATQNSEAFSVSSRKSFLSKAATTSAAIIATTPTIASAREGVAQRFIKQKAQSEKRAREKGPPPDQYAASAKAGSSETFRGGKTSADKIALGEELNNRQAEVANGLMDKMGL